MIVVDASTIIELLLNTEAATRIADRLFAPGESLYAPHLLDVEAAQVIRRYCLTGQLNSERGSEALADLADLPLHKYPHDVLLPRIWELRENLTAYDACYVALAEALDAPLLTADHRLAAASGHHAHIELIV